MRPNPPRARPLSVVLGAACALLLAAVVPTAALGGTVSVTGADLVFDGGGNENNELTVEQLGSSFRVTDDHAPLTAGTGCNAQNIHRATCPTAGVTGIQFSTGSGEDGVRVVAPTVATLDGGPGRDELTGGTGADTLIAGAGTNGFRETLTGGDGDDDLFGSTTGAGAQLFGGAGDDTLIGGPGQELLNGGDDADEMIGREGSDTTSYLVGAPVTVTLAGGADDGVAGEGDNVHADIERVNGGSAGDLLIGTDGFQTLDGGSGNDQLRGGPDQDFLNGGDHDDILRGEGGPDDLTGGTGADRTFGGDGIDDVNYNDRFDPANPITVSLNDVANDGAPGEGDNVRSDVENVLTGPADDTLIGNGLANLLEGSDGADQIKGAAGDDRLFGHTEFSAGDDNDTLNGANGDDLLRGGGGGDAMVGGAATDQVDYSSSSNPLTITLGGGANDGEAGEGDNVAGDVEIVVGGSAGDDIEGGAGPNFLFGAGGTDNLKGGGGDDLLDGENPLGFGGSPFADILNGGPGEDTASYHRTHFAVTVDLDGVADDGAAGENDNVLTNVENLIGTDASDTLIGNEFANDLAGRGQNDTLTGGDGPDYLAGGGGIDTHNGEGGNDRINSRLDGFADTDNCGDGNDAVIGDSFDVVNPDCETVSAP